MKEIEIKLRVADRDAVLQRLQELGWTRHGEREMEKNFVYDSADGALRNSGRLLRVRSSGADYTLTLKLPVDATGAHKIKEEYEVQVSDFNEMRLILEGLEYRGTWRYEKFRTHFHHGEVRGEVVFDETPIGDFLELEGEASWIDSMAKLLDYGPGDYITDTYGALFEKYRASHPEAGSDMVFPEQK